MTTIPGNALAMTAAHPYARRTGGHGKALDAVAQELGMSTDDLTHALAGGQSMTEIAASKGVSKGDLVATIAGTLPATGPDGQPVDATAAANRIADHTRTVGHTHHASGASGGSALGQGIDALSQALGVSSSDLMQRLTDGSGIADLLTANPDVATQFAALQNRGAIVDGYA